MSRPLPVRCLAEAAGTAFLVGLGTGAVVAAPAGAIGTIVLPLAWFAAVAIPLFAFAKVSGAHLNPAVTAALAGVRRCPAREVLPYAGAQLAGAFVGSAIVLLFVGRGRHLGATVPSLALPLSLLVVPLEFAFTLLLLLSVLYLTRPSPRHATWELLLPPSVVAFATFLIGPWTGSSLNPARSLAPAVLSATYDGFGLYLAAAALAAVAALAIERAGSLGGRSGARSAPSG
jgi:glycerol uptake facilitator-like aquaporin